MNRGSLEAIFRALNEADVRYLVAGGVAVIAHGYVRATVDLDLVLALDEDNVRRAAQALESLGYRPRAPVSIAQFGDEATRRDWVKNKNLIVFSLWSTQHVETAIDLFVEHPFDFEAAYARAARFMLGMVEVTAVPREELLAMKRTAGRSQDLADIEKLELIEDQDGDTTSPRTSA